jgi:hypothetical protein
MVPFDQLANLTWTDAVTVAAGCFFVLWIASALSKRKAKERRYYVSKIPSELIIEHEA